VEYRQKKQEGARARGNTDCLAWLETGDLNKMELGVTVNIAGFYVDLTQTFRNTDRLVQNNFRNKENQVFLFPVMSEANLKLFCYSSCPLLLHLLLKEMQDNLSIGRVLLSPGRLLSALLVSEMLPLRTSSTWRMPSLSWLARTSYSNTNWSPCTLTTPTTQWKHVRPVPHRCIVAQRMHSSCL